jgi:hypothetical protein
MTDLLNFFLTLLISLLPFLRIFLLLLVFAAWAPVVVGCLGRLLVFKREFVGQENHPAVTDPAFPLPTFEPEQGVEFRAFADNPPAGREIRDD